MEERTPGAGIGAAVGMLAPLTAPLAAVAILRLFPPLDPSSVGVAWLLPAGGALAAAVVGIATLISLSTAIGHGRPRDLVMAAAMGLLTGCLAANVLGAPALPVGAVVAAVALLGAALSARITIRLAGGRDRLLGAAAALVWVEAALAILLLLAPSLVALDAWRGPLLAVASGVAAGAAIASIGSARPLGLAWIAVGFDALAFSRPDSVELLAGLAALGAGTVCLALMDRPLPTAPRTATDAIAHDGLPELAEGLPDGVLLFDRRLLLREWNPVAATLFGLTPAAIGAQLEDLLGVSLPALQRPGPRPRLETDTSSAGAVELSAVTIAEGVVVLARDVGGPPELRLEADRLGRELRGTIEELLRSRRTIDLQRTELEQAATIDGLTGVASRDSIIERLRIEVAEARRYAHPVAIVLVDVDGFGELNRVLGMAAGDAVLRELALRMRLRVRSADALGRTGGDTFLAILPHSDEAAAATFADALRQRLARRSIAVGEGEVQITVSVGVAVMRPGEELGSDGLMARASEALVSAREEGGDRVALDSEHRPASLDEPRLRPPEPLDEESRGREA